MAMVMGGEGVERKGIREVCLYLSTAFTGEEIELMGIHGPQFSNHTRSHDNLIRHPGMFIQ